MAIITFRLNGTEATVNGALEKPLLWVLREDFALCGTKFGCGTSACGACTVLLNRQAVRSCRLHNIALSSSSSPLHNFLSYIGTTFTAASFTGQAFSQAPHPIHFCESIYGRLLSSIVIASAGHRSLHIRHALP